MNAAVSSLSLPRAALPGQPDEGNDVGLQSLGQAPPMSPPPGIAARTADLARGLSQLVATAFQPPRVAPAAEQAREEGEGDDDEDGDDMPPTPAADLSLAAAQKASCAASDSQPVKLFRNASSRRTASGGGRAVSGNKGDIENAQTVAPPVEEEEEAQCPVSVGSPPWGESS